MTSFEFDWSDLAFASKKSLKDLNAIFIAAPRHISQVRLKQLVKTYLPKANLIIGLAKEEFIKGFEDQPQFTSLKEVDVRPLIDLVSKSKSKNKLYTLSYRQDELKFILEKIDFQNVVLINGSWKYVFHSLPAFFVLSSRRIPYDMISPFASESEAKAYAQSILPKEVSPKGVFSDIEMMSIAEEIAKRSFDYCFQTGLAAGKKNGAKYRFILQSFNKVEPYQTYAMHFGSVREANFAPLNDLNFYDTAHAEVTMVVSAQRQSLSLTGASLFVNLLPCPNCARMLCDTDVAEVIYKEDHSDGFAAKLLNSAGIKVKRLI